jgi:hypothetical protein
MRVWFRNEYNSLDEQLRSHPGQDSNNYGIIAHTSPRSSMDRAPDFESVGWGFESLRGRHQEGLQPLL